MKKCLNCGRFSVNNNAVACAFCGGVLVEEGAKSCPKCGMQINPNWLTCPICSASLTGKTTSAQKKKIGMLIIIAVLIIALIGGIVALCIHLNDQTASSGRSKDDDDAATSSSSGSASDVVYESDEEAVTAVAEKFITAYSCTRIEKFSDKFYNCEPYVLEESKAYKRIEHFRDMDGEKWDIELHNAGAERSEFKIVDVEIDGNEAVVKIELTCVDEEALRQSFRTDYEWLFGAWLAYPNGIYDPDELTSAQREEMKEKFEEENEEQIHEYYIHAIEAADFETFEGELFMEKHDGRWYVVDTQ